MDSQAIVLQIELVLLGVATVFDTVLLLIVTERVNRAQIASWLYALLIGLWLVHAASFSHELLRDMPGAWWLSRLCHWATSAGLLLLPSAMLHAALALNFGRAGQDRRFAWLYLPMIAWPWVMWQIWHSDSLNFMDSLQQVAPWYLLIVVCANVASICLFWRVRSRLSIAGAPAFFLRLTLLLVWMTAVLVCYYLALESQRIESLLRFVLIVSPILPALLFVWHSLNQRLLPLVMERTLLYGASLVVILFLHRLLVAPIANMIEARAKVDLLMVEGWLLVALILAWPPLRSRFREAVRYLFSSNVHQIRDATRRLSVELSQLPRQSIDELLDWMSESVRKEIAVDMVAIALQAQAGDHPGEPAGEQAGDQPNRHPDGQVRNFLPQWTLLSVAGDSALLMPERQRDESPTSSRLATVHTFLSAQTSAYLDRSSRLPTEVDQALQQLGMMWAFRLHFRSVRGLVLMGPRLRNDRLADEQLNALTLLFDQFAATLHNRHVELQRQRAERRVLQQEKLSMLGLLAGSLAHELRNPLSSMRTIASLMLEDMGPKAEHARDVTIMISEIDRLTQTTGRLLDFSRPASEHSDCVQPDRVLLRLMHVLEHVARQSKVTLEMRLQAGDHNIAASDASLSEILFNLVKNAIEAAGCVEQGRVTIETRWSPQAYECCISDNGPGIADERKAKLFEPFITGKPHGTGLGLYIVNERVRELSGSIRCHSQQGEGCRFELTLPLCADPDQSHGATKST